MMTTPVSFAFLGWPEIVVILTLLLVLALGVGAVVIIVLLIVRATQTKSGSSPPSLPPPIHKDQISGQ